MSRTFRFRHGYHNALAHIEPFELDILELVTHGGLTMEQLWLRNFHRFHRDHNHTFLNRHKVAARESQRYYRRLSDRVLQQTLRLDQEDQAYNGYALRRHPKLKHYVYF